MRWPDFSPLLIVSQQYFELLDRSFNMRTSPRTAASRHQQFTVLAKLRLALKRWPVTVSTLVFITSAVVFTLWRSVSAQSALNISTVAGSSGGAGLVAEFLNARGIAAAQASVIYIADTDNHVVRKVDVAAGTITIFAGQAGMAATDATAANGDGAAATAALLNSPSDVAIDTNGDVYIADSGDRRIRKVTVATGQISTVAGSGFPGSSEG